MRLLKKERRSSISFSRYYDDDSNGGKKDRLLRNIGPFFSLIPLAFRLNEDPLAAAAATVTTQNDETFGPFEDLVPF